MEPTSPTRIRAVITGLMLAIVSASSLVAFSLLAGSADNPRPFPVAPHHASAAAAPVVIAGDDERTATPPQRTSGGPTLTFEVADAEPAVLGTRLRNHPKKNSEKHPSDNEDAPSTPFGPESEHSCRCDSGPKNNGNAYGHYKNKAHGNANGHDNATPPGHAKSSKKG